MRGKKKLKGADDWTNSNRSNRECKETDGGKDWNSGKRGGKGPICRVPS